MWLVKVHTSQKATTYRSGSSSPDASTYDRGNRNSKLSLFVVGGKEVEKTSKEIEEEIEKTNEKEVDFLKKKGG